MDQLKLQSLNRALTCYDGETAPRAVVRQHVTIPQSGFDLL